MARWEGDELRIELPRVTEAHVRIVGGDVAVTAASGTARVDVEVVAGENAWVELEDGVLTVVHEPVRWIGGLGGRRTEALVTLKLPPDVPLTVRTVSADVVVAGVQADLSVNTVSGAIVATDLRGDVVLRSVSGEIEAQQVDGEVTLNTVSGAATVAGRVPKLAARAVSADLTFDLDVAPDASLSTVSGEVLMRLPAQASLRVDATTMSGHLDSAFAIDGTTGRRRLSGTIGRDAAAPQVTVHTMSGDVALLSRDLAPAYIGLASERELPEGESPEEGR